MKIQKIYKLQILLLILLLAFINESNAQYFPDGYFDPVKISGKPRTNNSFFYASYGIYGSGEIDEVTDALQGPFEKELAITWFKNKSSNSKKGFELMFKYNKKQYSGQTEDTFFGYYSFSKPGKDYSLKISTVGRKGVSWSYSILRSVIDNSYGLWGSGVEMTVGGHPYLNQKKHKWPLSWTLGYSAGFQQKPAELDSEAWTEYRSYSSTLSMYKLHTNFSLQHFPFKKRLGWYFRMDVGAYFQMIDIWHPQGVLYSDGLFARAGLSTGLVF